MLDPIVKMISITIETIHGIVALINTRLVIHRQRIQSIQPFRTIIDNRGTHDVIIVQKDRH